MAMANSTLYRAMHFARASVVTHTELSRVGSYRVHPIHRGRRGSQTSEPSCHDRMSSPSQERSTIIDWNAYERSWDFQSLPILTASSQAHINPRIELHRLGWTTESRYHCGDEAPRRGEQPPLHRCSTACTDELTPDVPIEEITLTVNPAYRYGGQAHRRGAVDPLPARTP